MLPPGDRLGHVLRLVDEGKYFTLHAGRQTGKTTCARWLVDHLNQGDQRHAIWVDVETAREEPEPTIALKTVLGELDLAVQRALPKLGLPADRDRLMEDPSTAVLRYLMDLSRRCPRPLVVMMDEADGLVGPAMVSFLTQLRRGYIDRSSTPFPCSVALVGMRRVRDYVLGQDERRQMTWLGTTSPFNIAAEAATLAPFSEHDVAALLTQHTAATGQRFEPDAVTRIWALSQGQPWLVNALADQIVARDVEDRSVAITAAHVEAAKETIILERRTHIDSLIAKLREPRVRRILDPMLAGGHTTEDTLDDDFAYVMGLGLIRMREGRFEIANPIYREVIPRALTYIQQAQIPVEPRAYARPDGSLDLAKLMADWQVFWRKDGHLAAQGFSYRESGPHLMLMAFLQRIVNGGGRVEREYALGRGALDLVVEWRGTRHAIEVKLRRDTETEEEALEQVANYLDTAGLEEGWLVLFDLRSGIPWVDRLTKRDVDVGSRRIHVVGC
jgi:type II secretory pathway predicted ATPase ExeA